MSLRDWSPRERPGLKPLVGHHTLLEPLDWSVHADGLYGAVAAPQVQDIWTYMPIGPFRNREHFQTLFEAVRQSQGWEVLVIRQRSSEQIVGMASFMRVRETHGSAEVGCVAFGADLKRKTEATEAMALMASHIFDDLGYRRYEWKCDNKNAASKRAALRLGFAFEGVFRNDMVVRGQNRDTAWFAMTDSDWPSLKSAFDTWLSADNFDAAGLQIKSLEACRA